MSAEIDNYVNSINVYVSRTDTAGAEQGILVSL